MSNWIAFVAIFCLVRTAECHDYIDGRHGFALTEDGIIGVFTEVDTVALTVQKNRPIVSPPSFINLLKSGISGREEIYPAEVRCINLWENATKLLEERLRKMEGRALRKIDGTLLASKLLKKSKKRRSLIPEVASTVENGIGSLLIPDSDQENLENAKDYLNREMPKISKEFHQQIIINGQLVDQIEQLKFFEEEAANLESCEIDVLKFLIEQGNNCEKYTKDLWELIQVKDGRRLQSPLPRVLTEEHFLTKIASLPNFNNTVFRVNPLLLESYMEMRFERLEINGQGSTLHFLMTYPIATASSFLKTYRVRQTGFFVGREHVSLKLPERLVDVNGKLRRFKCLAEFLDLCRVEQVEGLSSCIFESTNTSKCELDTTTNELLDLQFINLKSGLLITSLYPIHVWGKGSNAKKMVTIGESESSAHFLPWQDYSSIVVVDSNGEGQLVTPPESQHSTFVTLSSDYVDYNIGLLFGNLTTTNTTNTTMNDLQTIWREIEQQRSHLNNISNHLKSVVQNGAAGSSFLWDQLPLYLHIGQSIFVLYIVVQIVLCIKRSCNPLEKSHKLEPSAPPEHINADNVMV